MFSDRPAKIQKVGEQQEGEVADFLDKLYTQARKDDDKKLDEFFKKNEFTIPDEFDELEEFLLSDLPQSVSGEKQDHINAAPKPPSTQYLLNALDASALPKEKQALLKTTVNNIASGTNNKPQSINPIILVKFNEDVKRIDFKKNYWRDKGLKINKFSTSKGIYTITPEQGQAFDYKLLRDALKADYRSYQIGFFDAANKPFIFGDEEKEENQSTQKSKEFITINLTGQDRDFKQKVETFLNRIRSNSSGGNEYDFYYNYTVEYDKISQVYFLKPILDLKNDNLQGLLTLLKKDLAKYTSSKFEDIVKIDTYQSIRNIQLDNNAPLIKSLITLNGVKPVTNHLDSKTVTLTPELGPIKTVMKASDFAGKYKVPLGFNGFLPTEKKGPVDKKNIEELIFPAKRHFS